MGSKPKLLRERDARTVGDGNGIKAEIITRSLVGNGNRISRNHDAIAGGGWEWDQPKS
ncbi:MAG: hypothetical protein F6K30_18525 [Cyanothece sp. SIO2G6]|nr:hypothetical protein [Cyanothece sp. SIO2G6]